MKKQFLCNRCGSCCRVVGQMVDISKGIEPGLIIDPFRMAMNKVLREFPFKYDETGKCEHLKQDNTCSVYDHRPLCCDVDRLYKKIFKHIVSRKEFYRNNHRNCEILQNLTKE